MLVRPTETQQEIRGMGHPQICCATNQNLYRVRLGRQVVDQSEGILDVAPWKSRLILDDFAAVLHQPELGFFDIVYSYFKDRTQGWASLDKEVEVLTVKAD